MVIDISHFGKHSNLPVSAYGAILQLPTTGIAAWKYTICLVV